LIACRRPRRLLRIGLQHKRSDLNNVGKLHRAPAADALSIDVHPVRRSRVFNRHAAVRPRKRRVMVRNLQPIERRSLSGARPTDSCGRVSNESRASNCGCADPGGVVDWSEPVPVETIVCGRLWRRFGQTPTGFACWLGVGAP